MRYLIWTYLFSIILYSCSSGEEKTPTKFNHDEIEDRKNLFSHFSSVFHELESDYLESKVDRESKGQRKYVSINGTDGDTLYRDLHIHLKNFSKRMVYEFDFNSSNFIDSLENYIDKIKETNIQLRQYVYLISIENYISNQTWGNTVQNYENIEVLFFMLYDMIYKSKSDYIYRDERRSTSEYDNVLLIERENDSLELMSCILNQSPSRLRCEQFDKEGKRLEIKIFEKVDSIELIPKEKTAFFKITYLDRNNFVDLVSFEEVEDSVLIKVADFKDVALDNWIIEEIDYLSKIYNPLWVRKDFDYVQFDKIKNYISTELDVSILKKQVNDHYNSGLGLKHYKSKINVFHDSLKGENHVKGYYEGLFEAIENCLKGRDKVDIRTQFIIWSYIIRNADNNWTICIGPPDNLNFGVLLKGDTTYYYTSDLYLIRYWGGGIHQTLSKNSLTEFKDSLSPVKELGFFNMDGSKVFKPVNDGIKYFEYSTNQ
jgi:hypothetical protein